MLASRGVLGPGLSVGASGDIVWTLCSLAVHDLLVLGPKWSLRRYEDWLASALKREPLPDESAAAR